MVEHNRNARDDRRHGVEVSAGWRRPGKIQSPSPAAKPGRRRRTVCAPGQVLTSREICMLAAVSVARLVESPLADGRGWPLSRDRDEIVAPGRRRFRPARSYAEGKRRRKGTPDPRRFGREARPAIASRSASGPRTTISCYRASSTKGLSSMRHGDSFSVPFEGCRRSVLPQPSPLSLIPASFRSRRFR